MASEAATLNIYMRLQDQVTKSLGGIRSSLQNFGKSMVKSFTDVRFMIADTARVVRQAWALMEMGAQARQIEDSFMSMAATVGISGQEMKKAMMEASAGTINFSNVAAEASKLMSSGLGIDTVSKLMVQARAEAKLTGTTTEEAFTNISNAVNSGMVRTLQRAYGLQLSVTQAVRDFAIATGMTEEEVKNFHMQQAIANHILEKGKGHLEAVNLEILSEAEYLQVLKAQWVSFQETVGQVLLEIFSFVSGGLQYLRGAFMETGRWVTDFFLSIVTSIEGVMQKFARFDITGLMRKQLETLGEVKIFLQSLGEEYSEDASASFDKAFVSLNYFLTQRMPAAVNAGGQSVDNILEKWDAIKQARLAKEPLTLRENLQRQYEEYLQFTEDRAMLDEWYNENLEQIQKAELDLWAQKNKNIYEITSGTVNAMIGMFAGFINDFLAGSLKRGVDYFKEFGKAVLQILVQVIAKLIAIIILQTLAKAFFNVGSSGAAMKGIANALNAANMLAGGSSVAPVPAGSAQAGYFSVPRTGMYQLHGGESVLTRNQTASQGGARTVNVWNFSPTIRSWDSSDIQRNIRSIGNAMIREVQTGAPIRKVMYG